MIVTSEKSKRVISSHEFESVNCTIDAEDMRYVASLLRNNYSNPTLAVVREITANALDANLEAGSSRRVEVTVPSQLNAHFVVRDFGGGLSQEDIFGLYSKYGKSTKRDSNNYIGAFGIGKFAPLSYGNNFTVVSHFGGKKTSYNVFVNEDDDTRIVKLHEESSSEPTGLSIEVAVADDDVNTFREVIKNFFRFFSDEEMPKFIGIAEDEKFFPDFEVVMEGKDGSWRLLEDQQEYWARNHHDSHAIMGRVHYPLDPSAINFDAIIVDGDDKSRQNAHNLRELASQDNLYITFPIGTLKLHHSRESLEYSKQTQLEILHTLQKVREDIEEIAKEKLGDAVDLWDAKVKYAQVVNALPHGLRTIFENSFEWDGIKIDSPTLNRNYKYQDEVIITEYYKQDDVDATDGYKVRSCKSTRIHAEKNTQLTIQDTKTYHGNNLRARTLFKENEDLVKVVAVHWNCKAGKSHVYDAENGMGFSKINEERILTLSDIEKAKLQSKGKAVSGESRADVPLFELVEKNGSWKKTNSSYWLNCNESVDDLEDSLVDDEVGIYVALANYKVVDEHGTGQDATIDLEAFLRDVQGVARIIGEETGDSDFTLNIYGVRRKDCKKLSKGLWRNWNDFKKDFAKKYLVAHKQKFVDSEKAMAFRDNNYSMDDWRTISTILECKRLREIVDEKLNANHLLVQTYAELDLMQDDGKELTTIYNLLKFMEEIDKDWVDQNYTSTYDPKEFDNKCKEIRTKYPLLVNINNEIYGWQDMRENNFGKNIVQYVQLVDAE